MMLNRLLNDLRFKIKNQMGYCVKFKTRMHVQSCTVHDSILYLMKIEGTFAIGEETSRVVIHDVLNKSHS